MAANTKRIPIKWIRDGAKSAYNKQKECFICGAVEELELHHTHGLTNLLEKWAKETGTLLDTDEQVLEIRDHFIELFHEEIYTHVFTLCARHHKMLHTVYGKSPLLSTAPKQAIWIQKQKDKFNGILEVTKPKDVDRKVEPSAGSNIEKPGFFSKFISQHNSFSSIRAS